MISKVVRKSYIWLKNIKVVLKMVSRLFFFNMKGKNFSCTRGITNNLNQVLEST